MILGVFDHASSLDIKRFQTVEKAGRIEVTAMFAHLTPLADVDQILMSFQHNDSIYEKTRILET